MKRKEIKLPIGGHFNVLKDISGITLVALIVTIIILLILAGVTLGFVFGKNGIIGLSQNAGKNYMDAEKEESNTLERLYSSMFVSTNDSSQITINVEDLNKIIDERVEAKIQKSVGTTPTGSIISQMGSSAPDGYLACDGTVYNIEEYKTLAEYINFQFGSYNYWGGDGETTFAVPDLRGEFLRGTGINSHMNQGNGANVGIHQDATEHWLIGTWTSGSSVRLLIDSNTVSREQVEKADKTNRITAGYRQVDMGNEISPVMLRPHTYTSRPTNTSVLYCIKY